jgi:hypothetical protein
MRRRDDLGGRRFRASGRKSSGVLYEHVDWSVQAPLQHSVPYAGPQQNVPAGRQAHSCVVHGPWSNCQRLERNQPSG